MGLLRPVARHDGRSLVGPLQGDRFRSWGECFSARSIRTLGARTTLTDILFHRPLAGDDNSRWWHLLIFYGFVLLFFVTCYLMLAHYGHEALFTGTPYLLVTLVADLAGAGLILGVLVALFSIRKDPSPARDRTLGKATVLSLLGLVCVTGFLVEGLRIHVEGDPWKVWSPVGAVASSVLPSFSEPEGHRLFNRLWWLHSILALGLLASDPPFPHAFGTCSSCPFTAPLRLWSLAALRPS